MAKMAVRIEKIGRLNENSVRVLREIAARLGNDFGRVDYKEIERVTGIPRNTVKYSVDCLIQDGTVELRNGEISARSSIIWFDEVS